MTAMAEAIAELFGVNLEDVLPCPLAARLGAITPHECAGPRIYTVEGRIGIEEGEWGACEAHARLVEAEIMRERERCAP